MFKNNCGIKTVLGKLFASPFDALGMKLK